MAGIDLAPGTVLGEFVIEALIGTGGMSRVYRARQAGVDRPVALKVLSPALATDPDYVGRFRREAGMTRDLEHPAVLTVYAAGEVDDLLYIATRLVPGPTLAHVIAEERPDADRAVALLRPVAEALDHAHGRGVVHRDVKPSNVLVDADGYPHLGDFGIAKQLGTAHTATGQYFGSPRYMAPEQAAGATVGFRADLYSLACTAFEVLTGTVPFTDTDTVPLLLAHASAPVPAASAIEPSLPIAVDDVLRRGMAKRPADRFRSGREFVDALERALGTPVRRRRRRVRRRALLVAGAVTAVLVVLATAVTLTLPGEGATEADTALPPPAPRAAPATLDAVDRGAEIYRAALDGSPSGFVVSPSTSPSTAREGVRYLPGALELEAYAPLAETYTELEVGTGVKTFLGEMDLSTRPGSDVELCWSLRWAEPGRLANFVCLDTETGRTAFSVFRRGQGKAQIGDAATIDGIPSGRTAHLAVLVREHQLSLYSEGRLVLDVPNDQVPVAGTTPGIEMESDGGIGLVRIEGLRLSELGSNG